MERYRVFFATDIHGSDRCFRKFLAAANVYQAQALVLGGDIAGKAMVPIVQSNGDYVLYRDGEQRVGEKELEEVLASIRFQGLYPVIVTGDEYEALRDDPDRQRVALERLIVDQTASWCELARDRLAEHGIRCIITPGNDDPVVIDEVLEHADGVDCPERAVCEVGPIWLASLGNTNRTPWDTDREYDEDELLDQIDAMVTPVFDGRPLVFNFHCPPYASGLDTARAIDDDLRVVKKGGQPLEIPVGSHAVRTAVERYNPVVGLHGHIHESHGVCRIGASMCFNPGSDYNGGVLKGIVVDFDPDGQYVSHLLTTG